MKEEGNRKYKIEILMIEEGALKDYDNFDLTDVHYDLKYICRVVDSDSIIAVKGTYKQGSV